MRNACSYTHLGTQVVREGTIMVRCAIGFIKGKDGQDIDVPKVVVAVRRMRKGFAFRTDRSPEVFTFQNSGSLWAIQRLKVLTQEQHEWLSFGVRRLIKDCSLLLNSQQVFGIPPTLLFAARYLHHSPRKYRPAQASSVYNSNRRTIWAVKAWLEFELDLHAKRPIISRPAPGYPIMFGELRMCYLPNKFGCPTCRAISSALGLDDTSPDQESIKRATVIAAIPNVSSSTFLTSLTNWPVGTPDDSIPDFIRGMLSHCRGT